MTGEKKIPFSINISPEARKILEREACRLVYGPEDRLPLGRIVTAMTLWFEENVEWRTSETKFAPSLHVRRRNAVFATGNGNEQQNAESKNPHTFADSLTARSIQLPACPFYEQDGHAAAKHVQRSRRQHTGLGSPDSPRASNVHRPRPVLA
jgi:hypothetical protein